MSLPTSPELKETHRCPARNRDAFADLYDRHVDGIYWYCRRRLIDPEAAEDATSTVFMRALAAGPRYGDPAVRAWLYQIAHNVVINEWRAAQPCRVVFEDAWDVADSTALPEELAMAADERGRLEAALRALPEDQRRVMELQIAGLTGQEMAEVLGRSRDAVKMLRQRAIHRLRDLLSSDLDGMEALR